MKTSEKLPWHSFPTTSKISSLHAYHISESSNYLHGRGFIVRPSLSLVPPYWQHWQTSIPPVCFFHSTKQPNSRFLIPLRPNTSNHMFMFCKKNYIKHINFRTKNNNEANIFIYFILTFVAGSLKNLNFNPVRNVLPACRVQGFNTHR